MKQLHFNALAAAGEADRFSGYVQQGFSPFVGYINAAKRAAREREARSVVSWEAVKEQRSLRLEPLDTLVVLTGIGHRYYLAGLPGGSGAHAQVPLFIGAEWRPVVPSSIQVTNTGTFVVLSEAVEANTSAFWLGQSCKLVPAPNALPEICANGAGGVCTVKQRPPIRDMPALIVEGREPFTLQGSDGRPIGHQICAPEEGATTLCAGAHRLPWAGEPTLSVMELPEAAILTADNGVRWRWSEAEGRGRRRRGVWIRLVVGENDAGDTEAVIDPRAAYCEEGVRSVRTEKGGGERNEYRVLSQRRDTYQIELDRLPPQGSTVFLPANISGFNQQLNAVYRLKDAPLPHHRALLTLCEPMDRAHWPTPTPARLREDQWMMLKDVKFDGTAEQRDFVCKALGTQDFAFLEGPPGSGKTHAICELVLQLVTNGQRVLLCSTTHVAVDNVLERLSAYPQIEALRIGKADRIDKSVGASRLEERVDALCERWERDPSFAGLDTDTLERMALGTVLSAVNLTCGTTTGILRHPFLDLREGREQVSPGWAHFDVLILDEASKTTLQEFLVPAQLARRWVIVGDVRQLPPFSDPRDLEAGLADLSEGGAEGARRFTAAQQRACLIIAELSQESAGGRPRAGGDPPVRWLIREPAEVIAALAAEVEARAARDGGGPCVVRITDTCGAGQREGREDGGRGAVYALTVGDIAAGDDRRLLLLAAHWVLVPEPVFAQIERALPADLLDLRAGAADTHAHAFRQHRWLTHHGALAAPIHVRRGLQHRHARELLDAEAQFFREERWERQAGWRLARVHQLSRAKRGADRESRQAELERLLPAAPDLAWVGPMVDAIRDIGVRSVIEALRVPRTLGRTRIRSALTDAIPETAWDARARLLTRQHRMHPDISSFPRASFYEDAALLDANTLNGRDEAAGWGFMSDLPARRVWVDVEGREQGGANPEEIEAMRIVLEQWRRWAATNPRRDRRPWEVACLSFYNRQEIATRDMLRRLSAQSGETRFDLPNTRVACATVDRFQGREADLVLLSFRNTRRTGHADSPNRLNVAITRARHLLMIFGRHRFFKECPSDELSGLATATPVIHPSRWSRT